MKPKIERRVFLDAEIELRKKEEGDGTTLVGIAAPFGKESSDMGFTEIIKRGAFKKALERSDTVALFNHDQNFVLGREASGTLRLKEGRSGLKAEIDFPETQLVKDLVVSPVERGDIRGMSFGFTVAEGGDEITRRQDGTILRTIHEVNELFDVSVVTFPAYPDTEIAVRSVEQWEKDNPLESFDSEEDEPDENPLIVVNAHRRTRELEITKKLLED